jgi:hypothetical protein
MKSGQGAITSIVTFLGKRYFTVAGVGLVGESTTKVTTGEIITSDATYGINDDKVASVVEMTHEPLDGIIQIALSTDGSGFGAIAESSVAGTSKPATAATLNPVTGHRFALKFTLTVGTGTGPALTSVTLLAHPTPPRAVEFILPLLIADQLDIDSTLVHQEPAEEVLALWNLVREGTQVTLQIGSEAYNVYPVNFEWYPYSQLQDKSGWSGTFVITVREVTQ